jgi:ribosome maturation factor RimP
VEVREEVRLLAEPLAEEAGLELVDVEQTSASGRRVIRVLLDKPGGVTVGDCAGFSRRLADCLDMNQTIPGTYQLEVSSPGVQRPIRTAEAVRRFAGERVSLAAHDARDGRRNFEGDLIGPDGERPGVRTEDGAEHWFDWNEVKSLRLVVDPWARVRAERNAGERNAKGERHRGERERDRGDSGRRA